MHRYSAGIAILFLTGCCAPMGQFTKDPASGVSSLSTQGVITTHGQLKGTAHELPFAIKQDKHLAPLFAEGAVCGPTPKPNQKPNPRGEPLAAVALVPFIVAATAYVIDRVTDAYDRNLETLKDAAEEVDEVQIAVSPDILLNASCIAYLRFSPDPKTTKDEKPKSQLGLAVVFQVIGISTVGRIASSANNEPVPDYFMLQPIFVRARDSIAVTAPGKPIKISAGVVVKQIGSLNGIPTLMPIGETSTTVADVALTGDAIRCAEGKCKTSSIIPYPAPEGTVVIGVAVTESGDVGFRIDRRRAEAKAIAAAFGPAVTQVVQDHFTREGERKAGK